MENEIFTGCNDSQKDYWEQFFKKIVVLPFDSETSKVAVEIYKALKAKSKLIEIPDILIAATAIKNGIKLSTINTKHFVRIERLVLAEML